MSRNIFILTVLLAVVKCDKILIVIPTPSISHQVVFRPVIKELLNRDHEVTVITTDPVFPEGKKPPSNLKEINLHDLSYKLWNEVYQAAGKSYQDDPMSIITCVFRVHSEVIIEQLKDKSVMKLIKDKAVKFDLLILEECASAAFMFSYIFNAPVILMSSFGENYHSMNIIGAVTHPLLYPTQYHQRLYNLTICEQISELHNHLGLDYMFKNNNYNTDKMLRSIFGRDTPTLNELKHNVHMLFLYTHRMWLHNQPVPHNFICTWGIQGAPDKILPEDIQDYLNSSKNGVIYVSFGTNFKPSSMPPKTLKTLVKVFSNLPYNILWKWDTDDLLGKPENIKLFKWIPQATVLARTNVKLFITQGGIQSTNEAINAGVPLIGIPIFADQEYNTEKYVYFKIGLKLHWRSITAENFENAIMTILNDYDRYRKNVIHLRTLMQDQPKPPLESAIWWIEYILRHGGARQLLAPAADMSWTEYYELELVCLLLSGLIGLGTSALLIIRFIYTCMLRKIRVLS